MNKHFNAGMCLLLLVGLAVIHKAFEEEKRQQREDFKTLGLESQRHRVLEHQLAGQRQSDILRLFGEPNKKETYLFGEIKNMHSENPARSLGGVFPYIKDDVRLEEWYYTDKTRRQVYLWFLAPDETREANDRAVIALLFD